MRKKLVIVGVPRGISLRRKASCDDAELLDDDAGEEEGESVSLLSLPTHRHREPWWFSATFKKGNRFRLSVSYPRSKSFTLRRHARGSRERDKNIK